MKAIQLVSILALTLSANLILADNDPDYLVYYHTGNNPSLLTVTNLAPVTPNEADFDDVDLSCVIPVPAGFFKKVMPLLPRHADFDDDILPVHVGKLVPSLPLEADF